VGRVVADDCSTRKVVVDVAVIVDDRLGVDNIRSWPCERLTGLTDEERVV